MGKKKKPRGLGRFCFICFFTFMKSAHCICFCFLVLCLEKQVICERETDKDQQAEIVLEAPSSLLSLFPEEAVMESERDVCQVHKNCDNVLHVRVVM